MEGFEDISVLGKKEMEDGMPGAYRQHYVGGLERGPSYVASVNGHHVHGTKADSIDCLVRKVELEPRPGRVTPQQ